MKWTGERGASDDITFFVIKDDREVEKAAN
jgi:hypothetical protein